MSTFHLEIAGRVERHLKERRLVVFYDPRREFGPLVDVLLANATGEGDVEIGSTRAWLRRFEGSYLALRHEVEQQLHLGKALPGLVYVAGQERDRKNSPLMEYDLAGHTYVPQLRKLAHDILRDRFSDGQIDGFLGAAGVGYADIASFFDQASNDASILRMLYGTIGSEAVLAQWIMDAGRDDVIRDKGAVAELRALIHTRLGLQTSETSTLAVMRRDLIRYVLINEFRLDLNGVTPSGLDLVSETAGKAQRERIRDLAGELRGMDAGSYARLADQVEADFGLASLPIKAGELGAIDTFRFEEQRLLEEASRLLIAHEFDGALTLARGRDDSHWVRTNPRRLAQWSALQQSAELGQRVAAFKVEIASFRGKQPKLWIERYADANGWAAVDGMDRRLGAFLSAMDEDPVAALAISKVREAYSDWVRVLSEGFTAALAGSDWETGWEIQQTQVFDSTVKAGQRPTAFFVVDAFRFEMGQELAGRLDQAGLLTLRAAVAALPTITSVGMAALLPGASASFSVGATNAGIAGAIDGTVLPDWAARWKHLQAKVPGSVELKLEELLHLSAEALAERVRAARLVLVRSQDIDAVGEAGVGLVAQQAMATVIPNLARAVHRLSKAGIHSFVIAADHGHLLDQTQDDDMKIETPGGDTVELHRRCWVGRGGKTPAGAVRVSGAILGYDTDLDFIFPSGRGVFLAGGGLRYHHGGVSLQELIVPVLTLTTEKGPDAHAGASRVRLEGVPQQITNRTIGVRVELAPDLFTEPHWVRVVLLHQSEQVGEAGMVQGAAMDPVTKRVQLTPGQPATVGLMLSRDGCPSVKIVVLDADSDAVLAQSKSLMVSLTI